MSDTIRKLYFDLNLIKPSVPNPASDKFSRNIYQWVKKNHGFYGVGVWCRQRDCFDNSFLEFKNTTADRKDIYFGFTGDDDWLMGSGVRAIQVGNRETFAQIGGKYCIDITEWFWVEYLKRGRCLMDSKHSGVLYDADRFTSNPDGSRTCNWCGEIQKLNRFERLVVEEKWIAVAQIRFT